MRRKVGSFLVDLNVAIQIADGITTQIGLRFFPTLLRESNTGSMFVLRELGLGGLIVEKLAIIIFLLALRAYLGPRWEHLSERHAVELFLFIGGTTIIFLIAVIANVVLILTASVVSS